MNLRLKSDSSATRFYTGFPSFPTPISTFEYFEPEVLQMQYWRVNKSSHSSGDHRNKSSSGDSKILLTRTPSKVDNLSVFKDTAIKFFNYDSLIRLSVPIARINAKHNNVSASKQPADDMGGLQPTLLLSKGAMVMLTNLLSKLSNTNINI